MNWHAALFGFLCTLGVLAGVALLVWLINWFGETFGAPGAAGVMVVLVAVAVGIGLGISESDR